LGHKLYTTKETQGRGNRAQVAFTLGDFMLEEQVKTALENVRPSLQADGGDVEFVSVSEDGVVSVKLTGACGGCPMAQMTLKMGIENYLKKEVPEVSSVQGV
jgi:Fe-S cluster biogenesis protein NfuA